MDAGQLLPDDIMLGIVEERLAEPDAANGWPPRRLPPHPGPGRDLAAPGRRTGIDLAINLDVPEDVVVERISSRRVLPRLRNELLARPTSRASTGVCASCGGRVVQRDDDTEESVRQRLATYNEQTEPLLGWFEDQGLLATVDGVGDPEEIFERLIGARGRSARPVLTVPSLTVPDRRARSTAGPASGKRSIVHRGVFRGDDDDRHPDVRGDLQGRVPRHGGAWGHG